MFIPDALKAPFPALISGRLRKVSSIISEDSACSYFILKLRVSNLKPIWGYKGSIKNHAYMSLSTHTW